MLSLLDAVTAAQTVVERDFPECLAAFLGGSVVRGEATATSDLDIMVIVPDGSPTYRASFRALDWPIEVFVHTLSVHRQFAAEASANLLLDCHCCWRGTGKWVLRMLRHLDPDLASRLAGALQTFATSGDTVGLQAFAQDALDVARGRLWEGFRLSSQENG